MRPGPDDAPHADGQAPVAARARRPAWALTAAALALIIILTGLNPLAPEDASFREPDALGVVLVVVSLVALLGLRRAPLVVLTCCSGVVVLNAFAGYSVSAVQWPVWIALYACFAASGRGLRVPAVVVTAAGVLGYGVFGPGRVTTDEAASIALCVLFATIAGEVVHARRVEAEAVQARLRSERSERAAQAERAVEAERARWARDLHDALGHAVNVMVLQAGVARRVFDVNPAFAQEALGHVETVGRDALHRLDLLVRADPAVAGDSTLASDGTTADLALLVERVRATGRDVVLELSPPELGPGASRAIHLIVQEALTNALKHASGAIVVTVTEADGRVVAEVRSTGARPVPPGHVPGNGLVNMRERARLEGGAFEAGPDEDGFRVRAVLPLRGFVAGGPS
ncbi:sensor histidine kinase [Myceligenerans crystallogenes]|uniref:histidine kinase n=1 Tax=Myceligenerans crystallogenes TaxID=316335 RepID=A0ABN2N6H4_9MICO